jgi:hypothetical protein
MSGRSKRFFPLFSTASRQVLGSAQSPIQWVPEIGPSEIKRPEREADHSPYLMPGLKMVEPYLHYPIRFHGVLN